MLGDEARRTMCGAIETAGGVMPVTREIPRCRACVEAVRQHDRGGEL
jgi:hypothetical protein